MPPAAFRSNDPTCSSGAGNPHTSNNRRVTSGVTGSPMFSSGCHEWFDAQSPGCHRACGSLEPGRPRNESKPATRRPIPLRIVGLRPGEQHQADAGEDAELDDVAGHGFVIDVFNGAAERQPARVARGNLVIADRGCHTRQRAWRGESPVRRSSRRHPRGHVDMASPTSAQSTCT